MVESLGATPAQIVVERAMYWNANGVALGGWDQRAGDEAAVGVTNLQGGCGRLFAAANRRPWTVTTPVPST